jgi:adenylate cyclase
MNRAIGVAAVEFLPQATQGAARYVGRTAVAGITLEYEEAPFEWEKERRFSVKRTMKAGPLHWYRFGCELTVLDSTSTQVELFFEADCKSRLFAPVASLLSRGFLGAMERYVRGAETQDATAQSARPTERTTFRPTSRPTSHPGAGTGKGPELRPGAGLARKLDALKAEGVSEALSHKLGELISFGTEAEIASIRPYAWAREHGFDRRLALSCMLHGVNAGVLELRWALICPSCVGPSSVVTSLGDITPPGHCQFCDISYDLELDKAVEAVFIPHPAVRAFDPRPFCIGGPSRTPHVLAQSILSKDKPVRMSFPGESGRYRVFARGGATCSVEITPDGAASAELMVEENAISPAQISVKSSAEIHLRTTRADEFHVKFERLQYATDAASAYEISNLPEFRRHFSSELLKAGTPLKVARVALFFTDLTGSTALYRDVGDAAAFRFVDDHFDVLRAKIEANGGVIVKTMGDAVMASFLDDQSALSAASACITAFDGLSAARGYADRVGLKLGIYSGPCYVVTANGTLDYFGQTANVAARLQGLAESGELIMLKNVFNALDDKAGFHPSGSLTTKVKGVAGELEVDRLKLG